METNGLIDGAAYHGHYEEAEYVTLAELAERGGRITRLRLLADTVPGFGRVADVSYCHGVTGDGRPVHILLDDLDCYGMVMRQGGVQRRLVAWAKRQGVYAKGLGLLDQGNWSVLY